MAKRGHQTRMHSAAAAYRIKPAEPPPPPRRPLSRDCPYCGVRMTFRYEDGEGGTQSILVCPEHGGFVRVRRRR